MSAFASTSTSWKDSLEEQGYAVVPDVLSPDECDQIWNRFSHFSEYVMFNPLTAESYDHSKRFMAVHGIITLPSAISYASFVDDVRSHNAVKELWASIWNCHIDDLVCSLDRLNFMAPLSWKHHNRSYSKTWWHVDQRCGLRDLQTIQGYVDICGSPTEQHGGLLVLPESHLDFDVLADRYADSKWSKKDWKRFSVDELKQVMPTMRPEPVTSTKGSVVLWDSRLVHMNRANRHLTDPRFVIYVSYWPKDRLTPVAYARRNVAIRENRATSHWPDAREIFPKRPQWSSHIPSSVDEAAIRYNKLF